MNTPYFRAARAVWAAGRTQEVHLHLGFRARIAGADGVTLRYACCSDCQVFVNGRYIAFGPAKAAKGFFRVDELSLDAYLQPGVNDVCFIVAGYVVNSYALIGQPSFLTAEITAGDTVVAATGVSGFECAELTEFVQKTQRISYQRHFVESYVMTPEDRAWLTGGAMNCIGTEDCGEKVYIDRVVPYPDYTPLPAVSIISEGALSYRKPEEYRVPWQLKVDNGWYRQFSRDEVAEVTSEVIQDFVYHNDFYGQKPASGVVLGKDRYAMFSFGREATGMLSFKARCQKPSTLYIIFDEMENGGYADPIRFDCIWAYKYVLAPGEYDLLTFEPESMQFANFIVTEGEIEVSVPTLVQFQFHEVPCILPQLDGALKKIYDAAVNTFRQNTVDIYMDCPSRERAGWLCDSFFTSRVEYALTGKSEVERAFLQNYALPETFDGPPEGMLPMCYPADHKKDDHIPNWAMWFVLQLEEYWHRSGDRATVDSLRGKLEALMGYFEKFEKEYGLLCDLPGWVFVEWSKANQLVQALNFPTNMMYAKMLDCIARMYEMPQAAQKAARIREQIRALSFDGTFFHDRMVRGEDGTLTLGEEITEVCQYYAFFTDTVTKQSHPQLYRTLLTEFGPDRQKLGFYPDVYPANILPGNYLRMEILCNDGLHDQLLSECVGYLEFMADRTGTLWENMTDTASLNHGFASHIVHWLDRNYNKK